MRIAVAGATGRLGTHIVEVVEERGHAVVPISRGNGVDVVTGEGLANALTGVDVIIDAATGPSPDEDEATAFFTASARNLHEAGAAAGVRRMVVVSIIGIDGLEGGYSVAKVAHEKAALSGPIPVRILRAAQFHEFVGQLLDWGTQGDVGYVGDVQTQLVAARSVAEVHGRPGHRRLGRRRRQPTVPRGRGTEGRELHRRGHPPGGEAGPTRPRSSSAPTRDDPDAEANANGALLPGPDAILAGPTFEEWLETAEV